MRDFKRLVFSRVQISRNDAWKSHAALRAAARDRALTLMTTAMNGMEEVMAMLQAEGVSNKYKVMIGGGPISLSYADRIGADGYAPNASAAVKKAKELLERIDSE